MKHDTKCETNHAYGYGHMLREREGGREGIPPILKQERCVYSFHTSASRQLYRHGTVKEQRQINKHNCFGKVCEGAQLGMLQWGGNHRTI